MRVQVAVTDPEWAAFLRERPRLQEVNFWVPGGGPRRMTVDPGEPWLFKAKAPQPSCLVGGGYVADYTRLSVSMAWQIFGEGNGAGSLQDMRRLIGRARHRWLAEDEDPVIGCVVLRAPRFFTWTPPIGRELFAPNIVGRKSFELATYPDSPVETATALLFGAIEELAGKPVDLRWPTPTKGEPRLVVPRRGQREFRALVTGAYGQRCAITGSRLLPTLQAAHIRPVEREGQHRIDNGLLLRADVHLLFDAGYLGVHPTRRTLEVSSKLRSVYGNGDYFYERAGQPLAVPLRAADRPDRVALDWHRDTVFTA